MVHFLFRLVFASPVFDVFSFHQISFVSDRFAIAVFNSINVKQIQFIKNQRDKIHNTQKKLQQQQQQ